MFSKELAKQWADTGLVRYVDYALVKWLYEEDAELSVDLWPLLMAVSYAASQGQVCVNLSHWLAAPASSFSDVEDDEIKHALIRDLERMNALSTLESLVLTIQASAVVATGDVEELVHQQTPFVLVRYGEAVLLYLRRYWQAEQTIIQGITQRLDRATSVSEDDIRGLLAVLFGESYLDEEIDWQKVACGIAASNHFSIITGGPGTGKTTTVLRLLALLQGQRLKNDLPPLAIRLAAPTGKAAARLNESIAANLARIELPEIGHIQPDTLKQVIPTQVTTLHRLLRPKPNSRQFTHNKANPLVADVVVVDEASMIDIEMMASLFNGIEPETRVILLGDKDQLASVEAGYVLGDLCRGATQGALHVVYR